MLYAAENDHVEEELSEKTIRPILNVHPTMITSTSYFESFFACGSTLRLRMEEGSLAGGV